MTEKKPQKRTDHTRLAMIEAAIEIFGRDGFYAASNRELAKAAGVNLALISYHFDGKDGLYLAAFTHINAQISKRLMPLLKQSDSDIDELLVRTDIEEGERTSKCVAMMETLLFAMAEMLSSQQTAPWAKLILREQQEPSEAFEILYAGIMSTVLRTLSRLIAIAQHKKETNAEIKLCALNLIGQIQTLRAARATVLHHMGWKEISAKEIKLIKKQIRFHLRALFLGEHRL